MGNQVSIKKIGFEDVQHIIKHKKGHYLLINTLNTTGQQCLILNTVPAQNEESIIDKYKHKNIHIIIYGRNANDETIFKKYEQLLTLGFNYVYVYTGGLFEWLLLQDIYGKDEFPTTSEELDILKYRSPISLIERPLLQDID
jgi:hypothetical protein